MCVTMCACVQGLAMKFSDVISTFDDVFNQWGTSSVTQVEEVQGLQRRLLKNKPHLVTLQ